MIDRLEFFRTAVQKATASLNPDKAIPEFFQYIRSIMPLDAMTLILYDHGLVALRISSMRTENVSLQPDKIIPLSEKAQTFYQWPFGKNVIRLKRLQKSNLDERVLDYLKEYVGESIGSAILLRLFYNKQTVGICGFYATKDRYTQEHEDLLGMLSQIMGMVSQNSIRHYDQLRQLESLTEENHFLYQEFKKITGGKIIGADSGLREIMHSANLVSQVDTPVLIMGETGVGKELIADAIQQGSDRSNLPYIKVNCGAIPASLIDSELFGYEEGAFTGAKRLQKGRFERAHTGTVFLDEVAELPLEAQVRLLRVVQNMEIERIGGKATIPVDIRIIAATHRDISSMVKEGGFREDLYFRLNVFPLTVPPLRHRLEDIPKLLNHFVEKLSQRMKLKKVPKLKPGIMTPLLDYDWPGNIRELENLVERAIIINPEGPLAVDIPLPSANECSPSDENEKIKHLDEIIRLHLIRALEYTGGKISGLSGAAMLLDIHPNTLRARMDKLGINYRKNKSKSRTRITGGGDCNGFK